MRAALITSLILACGIASSAAAQGVQSPDRPAPTAQAAASSGKLAVAQVQSRAPTQNDDAAAALALTIRHREEQEQRIARIACAAGDASKCSLIKAETPSGPNPS